MSTTALITKIRTLLNDNLVSGSDVRTYTTSGTFTLSEPNVSTVTEVYVNDRSSNITHSFSSVSNKVTIYGTVIAGDTVEIDYTYYPNYSDTELKNYFQAALVHLSINGYGEISYDSITDAFYPDIEDNEENLIAIITATIIDPGNRTIRLPDITISVPNDLPTNQKISQYIASFKRGSAGTHGVFDIIP